MQEEIWGFQISRKEKNSTTKDSQIATKVKVFAAQSCLTLCHPWTIAHQAPLSTEYSRQAYWSGLSVPSPGDLPHPGIKPVSCITGRFLTV